VKRVLISIILLLSILGLYAGLPRIIIVRKISCLSQYGPCNQNIEAKLRLYEGQSLFRTEVNIGEFLISEEYIADFSTQFKLPNSLVVNLVERKAKYALTNKDKKGFALVDKTGTVIRIEHETTLPFVATAFNIPNVGESIDAKALFALNITYDIFSLYQTKEGVMESDRLEIDLANGLKVIFPLEGDRSVLLASLGLILNKLNEGGEGSRINGNNISLIEAHTIDLRFRNPVIK